MKQSSRSRRFISLALGMAANIFLQQAIEKSSMIYVVLAVIEIIAAMLNIARDYYDK